MNWKRISILAICATIWTACSGPKVLREERLLFPRENAETWWLWSFTQPAQEGRSALHMSFLAAASCDSAGNSVRMYQSIFADSTHRSGSCLDPGAQIEHPKRWPLLLSAQSDSAHAWQMRFDRKSARFISQAGDLQHPSETRIEVRTGASEIKPNLLSMEQDAWLHSSMMSGNGESLQLLVIHDLASLLLAGGKVTFMDIGLLNGERFLALFRMEGENMKAWEVAILDSLGNPKQALPFDLKAAPGTDWRSQNGKEYTLGFGLQVDGVDYSVRACAQDQEIQQGRASFWMGGISATVDGAHFPAGTGNMVILSR